MITEQYLQQGLDEIEKELPGSLDEIKQLVSEKRYIEAYEGTQSVLLALSGAILSQEFLTL